MFILGDIMLSAREALLKIEVVLDLALHLTDGGIELSSIELKYINDCITEALGNTNA